ncbi:MAG: hypothetical protein M0Q13_02525 [Methanothrix sp.]|jgi:hypothetical protein|nr:hypothetical protein [Methanothrix sp.]
MLIKLNILIALFTSFLFAETKVATQFNISQWFSTAVSNHWVLLAIILIVSILFITTFLLKGKISIKLPGGTGFDIDSSGKINKIPENPHAKCPYAIDFRHAFTKTTYVVSKISEIKYKGRLEEQMNYIGEQFVNIRTLYQKVYLEKLKSKLKDKNEIYTEDKYLYQDYRYYQAIIKLMIHDMESVIRASFINNHLLSYELDDYQRYIDLKFNVIKALEIDFIDTMYIGEWVITRDEIFEIHKNNRDELQKIIIDVYMRARKIAFNKNEEIKQLENEIQEYMNSTVGNNIKIEKISSTK